MHVTFIPYGKRSEVDLLFRDMEAQKFILKLQKEDKIIEQNIESQLRLLPLGVYDYIFPKEYIDIVLQTMIGSKENSYSVPSYVIKFLRKLYKLQKIPEYSKEKRFLWIKDNVNILVLGIHRDGDNYIEPEDSKFAGFSHECI